VTINDAKPNRRGVSETFGGWGGWYFWLGMNRHGQRHGLGEWRSR
jgi:hypothetical protein